MKIRKAMITTFDNPFDPFTEFDKWFMYDVSKMYNTCALLDKNSDTSKARHLIDENEIIEQAIDKIIELDFTNTYKKIVKEVEYEILNDEGEKEDDLEPLKQI